MMKAWLRIAGGSILTLFAIALAALFALNSYATPIQRTQVDSPLYTVGDQNYAQALDEGKNIVKFGRLPLGVYPGGVAFSNPADAEEHLTEIGRADDWGVYLLSGDFDLDTTAVDGRHYTTRSLLVRERVVR